MIWLANHGDPGAGLSPRRDPHPMIERIKNRRPTRLERCEVWLVRLYWRIVTRLHNGTGSAS